MATGSSDEYLLPKDLFSLPLEAEDCPPTACEQARAILDLRFSLPAEVTTSQEEFLEEHLTAEGNCPCQQQWNEILRARQHRQEAAGFWAAKT